MLRPAPFRPGHGPNDDAPANGGAASSHHRRSRNRRNRLRFALPTLLLTAFLAGWSGLGGKGTVAPGGDPIVRLTLPASEAAQAEPPFTRAELSRWLDLWPEFADWAGRHGLNTEEMIGLGTQYRRSAAVEGWLHARGVRPARFFTILERTALGLMRLEMRDATAGIQPQTEEQKRLIRENPEIPENQKRLMLRDPGTPQHRGRGGDGLSPAELRLVRTYRDRLMTVIGEGN